MIALGIGLEEYGYPYPVDFLPLTNDLQQVRMAYMDIPPDEQPNDKTIVLFHGKAFGWRSSGPATRASASPTRCSGGRCR
jgi:hypothetical protein